MIKKLTLCISLLMSAHYTHGIILESKVLQTIDGHILAWDSVGALKKYQQQIKHFLNKKHDIDTQSCNLFDLAIKEKNSTLTVTEKTEFEAIVAEFVQFSEPFIDTITPARRAIAPLVEESCEKRNRTTSILRIWIKADDGQEQVLFKKHVSTYRALAELCMDLLNFTEDLLSSCPHAMKSYNDFFDRINTLEPIIDALLVTEDIQISHNGALYHELVRYIAERFNENETINIEKTARLLHTFYSKKTTK
jgi:hypothetical protein